MIEFKKLENGFEYIEVQNSAAHAKIALQGAHIFHFAKKSEKALLWLSEESDFELGKAIRGGIPLCWPSFGMNNPDLPQHGFARVSMWTLKDMQEIDDATTRLIFTISHTQESLKLWNYKFDLEFRVSVSDSLTMELCTTNRDERPFVITEAFHSYFAVENISTCRIRGLEGKPYLDTLVNEQKRLEGEIYIDSEYDVVFQEVDKAIELITPNRLVKIQNSGSSSVIVWNPWIEKCSRMSAMPADAYKQFVCIESANAFEDFRLVFPQKSHTLITKISY